MNLNFTLTDINQAALQLLKAAGSAKVWALHGDMGAGKTTFVHALCQQLGVTSATSSPTYSIINHYSSPAGPVYHIDLYRLKDEEEVLQAGVEDCTTGDFYCFIEWPERAGHLLPQNTFHVSLIAVNENSRQISY